MQFLTKKAQFFIEKATKFHILMYYMADDQKVTLWNKIKSHFPLVLSHFFEKLKNSCFKNQKLIFYLKGFFLVDVIIYEKFCLVFKNFKAISFSYIYIFKINNLFKFFYNIQLFNNIYKNMIFFNFYI